jgi:molecular chaperone Hsp33
VTSAGAQWRVGGFLMQFLPDSPERRRRADLDPGDAPPGVARHEVEEDDAWAEARALAGTLEAHELIDPTLSSERLLYRLFHERGVKVFTPRALREACRCSPERIRGMLRSFTPQERRDMIGDDGKISVTCEFCSSREVFEPSEFDAGK